MLHGLILASFVCAAIPALLTVWNLFEYREPPLAAASLPSVTVVIPARNEEIGIAACVESVLASIGVTLEVLVVDDASTDRTAAIVEEIAARDTRLKLLRAALLPAGWNGKQHACWQGAQATSSALLCFLDADVRLQPGALARMATLLVQQRAALVSGFPRELTGTWLEKLLIPLIHFVLLGLLPMAGLRLTRMPGFAAGCGQFLLVERNAYFASGGHAAIRHTMHDGLLLPRLLRQHRMPTRLADMTALASCRMYRTAATTWNGLAKNATEGIAAPARIVPMTLLLAMGQVMPPVLVYLARRQVRYIIPFLGPPIAIHTHLLHLAWIALALSYLPRVINAIRYRQSATSALLHPFGVLTLLVLQWYALARKLAGHGATWKAREYSAN